MFLSAIMAHWEFNDEVKKNLCVWGIFLNDALGVETPILPCSSHALMCSLHHRHSQIDRTPFFSWSLAVGKVGASG